MRNENSAYPKAVFIISDGQGSFVTPEFPDRWHWFLTDRGSQRFISDESKVYKLRDFE
jgi:hypothetical protein